MAAICGSLSGLYLLTQDWLSTSNDTVSNLDPTLDSTTLEVDPTQIHLPDSIVDSSNSSTIDSSNSSTIDNSNSSEYRSGRHYQNQTVYLFFQLYLVPNLLMII